MRPRLARCAVITLAPLLLLALQLLIPGALAAQPLDLGGPDAHIAQQLSAGRRLTQAASPPPAATSGSSVPYESQLTSLLAQLGPGRPVTLKNVEAARFVSYAQAGARASPGKASTALNASRMQLLINHSMAGAWEASVRHCTPGMVSGRRPATCGTCIPHFWHVHCGF